jgi:hypothetical protein
MTQQSGTPAFGCQRQNVRIRVLLRRFLAGRISAAGRPELLPNRKNFPGQSIGSGMKQPAAGLSLVSANTSLFKFFKGSVFSEVITRLRVTPFPSLGEVLPFGKCSQWKEMAGHFRLLVSRMREVKRNLARRPTIASADSAPHAESSALRRRPILNCKTSQKAALIPVDSGKNWGNFPALAVPRLFGQKRPVRSAFFISMPLASLGCEQPRPPAIAGSSPPIGKSAPIEQRR